MRRFLLVYALALLAAAPAAGKPRFRGTQGTGAIYPPPPTGIARDGGSAFPLSTTGGGFGASGTSMARAGITTTATAGTLVAVFALGNTNGTNMGTPVVSGGGLTWTKQIEGNYLGQNTHVAQVWTAPFASALSSATVTATWTTQATSNWDGTLTVDALTGVASIGGSAQDVALSTAMSVTLGSVAAGSWSYVATFHESGNTTITPTGATTEISDHYGGAGCGSGTGSSTSTGSVSIGWSTVKDWGAVAALELRQ